MADQREYARPPRCPICSSSHRNVRYDLGWADCDGACHNDWHEPEPVPSGGTARPNNEGDITP